MKDKAAIASVELKRVNMLQDAPTIRHYQRLTDALVDFWHRGYGFDYLRLYLDGYVACLRDTNVVEPYQVHRLEEEALRFLRDPSNFEMSAPQVQYERY